MSPNKLVKNIYLKKFKKLAHINGGGGKTHLKPKQKQVEKTMLSSQVNSYFFKVFSIKTSSLQINIPIAHTLINTQIRN